MKTPSKRALSWLIAALMTAALMTFVLVCTDVVYAENDDASIMRAFLGYESGTPANFNVLIHGLLAWPLYWLSTAFPGLPWFTYVQLALLALSCVVIAKSVMQLFVRHNKPLWLGAAFAALFLLVLCMKYVTRLTFTITAALLGAAAVLQMFSIDHHRGAWRVVLGMAGALALVAFSYALRYEGVLAVLAFCALTFVIIVWEHYGLGKKARRSLKPMVISLVMVAVVMAGLVGMRQWEIAANDVSDYLEWHNARSEAMDFHGLHNVPQEVYDQIGWDSTTRNLARKWFFLDNDVTTEAFQTINAYMQAQDARTLSERLAGVGAQLSALCTNYPLDIRCLGLAALAALICLIGACAAKRWNVVVYIALAFAGSAAMVIYLGLAGRLPLRAFLMVALPLAAILFAFLPACLPDKIKVNAACLAVCAVWCAFCLVSVVPALLPDEEEELALGSVMTDLEEYALYEPESLFIHDDTLTGADLRAFPTYSEGVPHNITFWGGWGMRSPESVQQFETFGIDLFDVDPEIFLRDDVYLASGRIDPPPTLLLDWLTEKTGKNIDWEIWSEYGSVYILHFYEY